MAGKTEGEEVVEPFEILDDKWAIQVVAEAQGGYAADGGGEYKDAGAAAEGYYAEDGTWVATPAEGREAKEGDEGATAGAAAPGCRYERQASSGKPHVEDGPLPGVCFSLAA